MEEKMNNKISEIKGIVKKLTEPYHYTEEQINMITIVYLSMIMLDDEIEDLLMQVLRDTMIIFSNYSVEQTYIKIVGSKVDKKLSSSLKYHRSTYFNYLVNKNGLTGIPFIIIPTNNRELYDIIDSLIHEIKHAINEVIPRFFTKDGKGYYYSGLALVGENEIYFEALDEAFNSFLTKIYLDIITSIKKDTITDKSLKNLLNWWQSPRVYEYSSDIAKRYQKVFSSKYLFPIFYNVSLYKKMETLDEAINNLFQHKRKAIDFYMDLELGNQDRRTNGQYFKVMNKTLIKEPQKIIPYIKTSAS